MVPLVAKNGFHLPHLHRMLYTTPKFEVAEWYASSSGSFHTACGAAHGVETKTRDDKDMASKNARKESPGKVFLCIGLDADVGPSYAKFTKAELLLPCCIVQSAAEAKFAEAYLKLASSMVLDHLSWDGASVCFSHWAQVVKSPECCDVEDNVKAKRFSRFLKQK